MDATISLKRSLRNICFKFKNRTPDELESMTEQPPIDTYLYSSRSCMGIGEYYKIYIGNSVGKELDSPGLISSFSKSEDNVSSIDERAPISASKFSVTATFPDGEVLAKEMSVVEPCGIKGEEISSQGEVFNDPEEGSFFANREEYSIQIFPTNVSFRDIWFWEGCGTAEYYGIVAENENLQMTHTPCAPIQLDQFNQTIDTVGIGGEILDTLNLKKSFWEGKTVGTEVGKFIWRIPLYCTLENPWDDPVGMRKLKEFVHTTRFIVCNGGAGEVPAGLDIISEKEF